MEQRKYPELSIRHDIYVSTLYAILFSSAWAFVYVYFANPNSFLNNSVQFLGGVLAISGLLLKQYMLKEVLEYLETWEELGTLLDKIIYNSYKYGLNDTTQVKEFEIQRNNAAKYSKYVKCEMNIIPIVPLLTIFLYGCALLADKFIVLRLVFFYGMIHCVVYLAIAATSSMKIAYNHPNLKSIITELKNLSCALETKILSDQEHSRGVSI